MTSSGGSRPPADQIALDTSTYAHLRRGHSTVIEWIAAASVVDVSATVLGELEAGFRLGSRYDENARTLADFLDEPFVRVRYVTPRVARRYGRIFSELRRAGTPIPVNDIWIAASVMETGSHLVTFDSDFARIATLEHTILAA